MKLFEIFDKSYVDNIVWRDYKAGTWGYFDLEQLRFGIDIQFQTSNEVKEKYELNGKYKQVIELLENYKFVRIDYCQVLDGEYRYDNTNNSNNPVQLLSTVATEAAKKLKDYNFDIVYFAAKEHSDGSKNQRMTLYPKIGRSMARKLNAICLTDNTDNSATITMLVKNVGPDKIADIREILER